MTNPAGDGRTNLPGLADIEAVRGRFPGLADDWAFFDNAGGSFALGGVAERAAQHLARFPVQLGGSYPASAAAARRVEEGRAAAARLIGADPDEVVLGSSTTANTLLLSQALAAGLQPGDEVVVTNLDHEANIGSWRRLAERAVTVREWRFDPDTLALRIEDLEPLLSERTRLVCFSHCSNIVGAFCDARAITERVHAVGARVCVDGVAYAPHRRIDVHELGVDFYVLSLYKVFGPHLGLLYVRREAQAELASLNHFFLEGAPLTQRLQPGNVNYELTSTLPAVIEYLERLAPAGTPSADALDAAYEQIAAREERLVEPLISWLAAHPRVRLVGPATADRATRAPTVSFTVDGLASSAVPPRLEREQVAVRYGHFYAYRLIRDLGLGTDGVVRASLVHYNTEDEVERLVRALDRALDEP